MGERIGGSASMRSWTVIVAAFLPEPKRLDEAPVHTIELLRPLSAFARVLQLSISCTYDWKFWNAAMPNFQIYGEREGLEPSPPAL